MIKLSLEKKDKTYLAKNVSIKKIAGFSLYMTMIVKKIKFFRRRNKKYFKSQFKDSLIKDLYLLLVTPIK